MADPQHNFSDLPEGAQVVGYSDLPPGAQVVEHPQTADVNPGFFSSLAHTLLPSTNVGDYFSGPTDVLMAPFNKQSRERVSAGLQEMGHSLVAAHKDQFSKMGNDLKTGMELQQEGHPIDAFMSAGSATGHLMAGLLPAIGPGAAHAGERFAEGQVLGGLGETTGLLAPFGFTAARASRAAQATKPSSLITQAIKPGGARAVAFEKNVQTALPALQEAAETTGTKFNSLDNLANLVPKARQMFWQKYENMLGPNVNAAADTTAVADAMESQITPRFERLNPKGAARIRKQAEFYKQNPMTLGQLEEELQGVNNELSTYYAKNKVGQATAAADPAIGHSVAEAEALRKVLYSKLDTLTTGDAAALKRTYGALRSLEEPILKRQGALAQQSPFDLGDRFMLPSGTGDIARGLFSLDPKSVVQGAAKLAANRTLNQANRSNHLINKAYGLTVNPQVPPMVAPSLGIPLALQATHTFDPNTGELIEH